MKSGDRSWVSVDMLSLQLSRFPNHMAKRDYLSISFHFPHNMDRETTPCFSDS